MPLVSSFSKYLTDKTNFAEKAGSNGEVFTYAIIILISNISALAGITLLAWVLNTLKVTLLIWVAFFSLRIVTGGRHQHGPLACWLLTVVVFTALGYIVANMASALEGYTTLLITLGIILSLYAVVNHAPVTITTKKFSPAKKHGLKTVAIVIIIAWSAIVLNPAEAAITAQPNFTMAVITGLVAQSISLLPLAKKHKD